MLVTYFYLMLLHRIDLLWLIILLSFHEPSIWAAQYVDTVETRFQQFVVKYNRTYARNSTEYRKRLDLFAVSSYHMLY